MSSCSSCGFRHDVRGRATARASSFVRQANPRVHRKREHPALLISQGAGSASVTNRRIVVLGIMGRTPVAGVAWQVLHYLEGFRRLGHEVYYVEDTLSWPYNPETNADDCRYTLNYISRLM